MNQADRDAEEASNRVKFFTTPGGQLFRCEKWKVEFALVAWQHHKEYLVASAQARNEASVPFLWLKDALKLKLIQTMHNPETGLMVPFPSEPDWDELEPFDAHELIAEAIEWQLGSFTNGFRAKRDAAEAKEAADKAAKEKKDASS